jgi:hypothetical protein
VGVFVVGRTVGVADRGAEGNFVGALVRRNFKCMSMEM